MRFYYQSHDASTGQKVATKCIRVSSTATTKVIIENLIEKFRPDMKMLEVPEYALYEIHESGERKLGMEEKPLLVQLNWHKDDREGRFLLRRIDDVTQIVPTGQISATGSDQRDDGKQPEVEFKRKLSKREKKELKKQEKLNKLKNKENKDESVAEKLYTGKLIFVLSSNVYTIKYQVEASLHRCASSFVLLEGVTKNSIRGGVIKIFQGVLQISKKHHFYVGGTLGGS